MKMTKTQLQQIIKEELEAVMNESYTSTQTELSDIDRKMQAMLSQPGGALDQEILAKVDAAGAKYLKSNQGERGELKTPYERMADADIRVLHFYVRRTKDGQNTNNVAGEDFTRAYGQFTDIDREFRKRGLES